MTTVGERIFREEVVLRSWKEPAWFLEFVLGFEATEAQKEIAEAVRDGMFGVGAKWIAVRAGNGVGKTAIAARMMLWAMRTFPEIVVVTTAPTERQVEEILWREARAAYKGSRVPLGGLFYEGQARWQLDERRFAIGLSPQHNEAEKLQGFHAPRMLFIVDEASAVPEAHWEAIKGTALAGNVVVLAIGNPIRLEGEFYEAFHGKAELWKRIHVSAFETPNFTIGAGCAPGLVGPEGVELAKREWGGEGPLWDVRVLGNFPTASAHGLFDLTWLEKGVNVERKGERFSLGVDVAGEGTDETALALLQGNRLVAMETVRGQNPMWAVGRVKTLWDEHKQHLAIAVDDGGVGGGAIGRLRELSVVHYKVSFGGAAEGPRKEYFRNKGSEIYWSLREALQAGEVSLPNEGKLFAQLMQVEWELESDKSIMVHKKGLRKKKASPDRADALALAWHAKWKGERGLGVLF